MEIYLRDIRLTDIEEIHDYASLNEVVKFQTLRPNTIEQTREYVMDILNRESNHHHKVIVLKKSRKVISAAQMSMDINNNSAECGYILHPEYWGNGIVTKVAKHLLNYGFNELDLNRIWATTDKRNIGSERVLQKVGMTKEGLLRQNIKLNDGYRDTLVYCILKSEYDLKYLDIEVKKG